jgi:hypothetical protein
MHGWPVVGSAAQVFAAATHTEVALHTPSRHG